MRFLTPLLVLLLGTCVRAQLGLHPPAVDWQQIVLPEGRVLYPKGYAARAKRVATLIELLEAKHGRSIGEKHYRFDLVLQTANTTINGYVGLAPFRSEFFLTPPQGRNLLGAGDWSDLLTIHEYRHVQQNSNERRGITKLASYLFGQQGWAGFSSFATPNWFSEGDAVIAETALTAFGRGRTPAFSAELRSLLDNDIIYRYPRARNGSFKKLVPDHYRYGYAILTYAREEFGNDVWKSVLHDGARYKGLFYPFSRALRKKTGYKTHQLYRTTMADLARLQDSARAVRPALVEGRPIGQSHNSVVDYNFPQRDGEGRLLALRSGYQYRPSLVVVDPDGGKDRVIAPVGIQREPYVDVRGNLAVWMENRQHPRYTNQQFSDVIVYELRTGRKRQVTENGKYFSPTLSPDRREVAVVSHDVLSGDPSLVILATQSGEVLEEYRVATNALVQPRFGPDGRTVYFLDQDYQGIAIRVLDRNGGKVRTVRERNTENIDMLRVAPNGWLTFSSGRDGVDNVFTLDPASGEMIQLTNVAIGALAPRFVDDNELVYVAPTPRGRRLRQLTVREGLPGGNLPVTPSVYERPGAYAAEASDLPATITVKDYPTRDASDKLFGYKLHSWTVAGTTVAPGFSVQGGNALNTIQTNATVLYNTNTDELITQAAVSYGGWFPVVTGTATFTERQFTQLFPGIDTSGRLRGVVQNLNQTSFGLTATVPLRWVKGEFRSLVSPSVGVSQFLLKDRAGEALPANFTSGQFGLTAAISRRRTFQQVFSTLSASVSLRYNRGFGSGDPGSSFLLRSRFTLPGFHRTHGFALTFDYQQEDATNPYQYPDFFQYTRGYDDVLNDNVYRFGLNYQLPVWYPDVGALGVYYLKRVRLNPFFDHGRYSLTQLEDAGLDPGQVINSAGLTVFIDGTIFNFADVAFGLEFSRRLSNHAFGPEAAGTPNFRFLAVTVL